MQRSQPNRSSLASLLRRLCIFLQPLLPTAKLSLSRLSFRIYPASMSYRLSRTCSCRNAQKLSAAIFDVASIFRLKIQVAGKMLQHPIVDHFLPMLLRFPRYEFFTCRHSIRAIILLIETTCFFHANVFEEPRPAKTRLFVSADEDLFVALTKLNIEISVRT